MSRGSDRAVVGLIGAGIMGHGMAANLIEAGFPLHVVAHRNRVPIDDLVARGAVEVPDLASLAGAVDTLILCVTDTPAARSVIAAVTPHLRRGALLIDTTTNVPDAPPEFAEVLSETGGQYVEAPVTGGADEARRGALGAIVGCDESLFERARGILEVFCARVERFGEPGMAARAKLVSNFLALGTATLVIETFRQARALGVDWAQLYELAQLGSGNSLALRRIIDAALEGDAGGYKFTVRNTLKDLSYFYEMIEDGSEASELAPALKAIHERAVADGHGDRMLSELLDR